MAGFDNILKLNTRHHLTSVGRSEPGLDLCGVDLTLLEVRCGAADDLTLFLEGIVY